MPSLLSELNTNGAYLVIVGTLLLALSAAGQFSLQEYRNFEREYAGISDNVFRFLIWPALSAKRFFDFFLGTTGPRLRDQFTRRSVTVTFLVSALANMFCIYLIFTSIPADLPVFEQSALATLIRSCLMFQFFNFFGDLVSLSVTRKVLSRITAGKTNYIKYIAVDIAGIILGYLITFFPSAASLFYAIIFDTPPNELIQEGVMGSFMIPFFLFIFATSLQSLPLALFSFIAVFSITIPTATYLFLICFQFITYRSFLILQSGGSKIAAEKFFWCIKIFANFLVIAGGVVAAWVIIFG